MKQRLFIVIAVCHRVIGHTNNTQIERYNVIATSSDEAYGYTMRDMKSRFPETRGYQAHDVDVKEVTPAQLREWLAALERAA